MPSLMFVIYIRKMKCKSARVKADWFSISRSGYEQELAPS